MRKLFHVMVALLTLGTFFTGTVCADERDIPEEFQESGIQVQGYKYIPMDRKVVIFGDNFPCSDEEAATVMYGDCPAKVMECTPNKITTCIPSEESIRAGGYKWYVSDFSFSLSYADSFFVNFPEDLPVDESNSCVIEDDDDNGDGGVIGGPIIADRLFFFGNNELCADFSNGNPNSELSCELQQETLNDNPVLILNPENITFFLDFNLPEEEQVEEEFALGENSEAFYCSHEGVSKLNICKETCEGVFNKEQCKSACAYNLKQQFCLPVVGNVRDLVMDQNINIGVRFDF